MPTGYAKLSIRDANKDAVIATLRDYGCRLVFTDPISALPGQQKHLLEALGGLHRGSTFVVPSLDRLTPKIRELLDLVADLGRRGVRFVSLEEGIDTATRQGQTQLETFAVLSEYLRETVRERAAIGSVIARKTGRTGGRPTKMPKPRIKIALEMLQSPGITVAEVARTLRIDRATLYRHVKTGRMQGQPAKPQGRKG